MGLAAFQDLGEFLAGVCEPCILRKLILCFDPWSSRLVLFKAQTINQSKACAYAPAASLLPCIYPPPPTGALCSSPACPGRASWTHFSLPSLSCNVSCSLFPETSLYSCPLIHIQLPFRASSISYI